MELIESEHKEPVLAEPEPRYQPVLADKNEHGQTWVRLVLTILLGIILVVLIVFFARWVYHKVHHKTVTTPQVSVSAPEKQSSNTPAAPSQPANPPGPSSNTTNTTGGTASSAPSTGTNSQITNTGPGDVTGLFIGASLAAAGLHYIISVRRFAKNS